MASHSPVLLELTPSGGANTVTTDVSMTEDDHQGIECESLAPLDLHESYQEPQQEPAVPFTHSADNHDCPSGITQDYGTSNFNPLYEAMKDVSLDALSPHVLRGLQHELDHLSVRDMDHRGLGHRLGFTYKEIEWIRNVCHNPAEGVSSPTHTLLHQYKQHANSSVGKIVQALQEMGHITALEVIDGLSQEIINEQERLNRQKTGHLSPIQDGTIDSSTSPTPGPAKKPRVENSPIQRSIYHQNIPKGHVAYSASSSSYSDASTLRVGGSAPENQPPQSHNLPHFRDAFVGPRSQIVGTQHNLHQNSHFKAPLPVSPNGYYNPASNNLKLQNQSGARPKQTTFKPARDSPNAVDKLANGFKKLFNTLPRRNKPSKSSERVSIQSTPEPHITKEFRKGDKNIKLLVTCTWESSFENSNVIEKFCNHLKTNGFQLYIDKHDDMRPAGKKKEWISHIYPDVDFVLVCITPEYQKDALGESQLNGNKSKLLTRYIYSKILEEYRQNNMNNKRIVPVLFNSASWEQIPDLLKNTLLYRWPESYQSLFYFLSQPETVVNRHAYKTNHTSKKEHSF